MAEGAEDFCGLTEAALSTMRVVEMALDGDSAQEIGEKWSLSAIRRAHSALESCQYLRCYVHRDVDAAIRVLAELIDEEEAADTYECPCRGTCSDCTPGVQRWV